MPGAKSLKMLHVTAFKSPGVRAVVSPARARRPQKADTTVAMAQSEHRPPRTTNVNPASSAGDPSLPRAFQGSTLLDQCQFRQRHKRESHRAPLCRERRLRGATARREF
ncbi:hypothetical protein KM043_010968 [Ampulex compressa]|nr:hypothetical protein KM043_010968 [Ampulex compressa]